jgi:hypothetical protein
MTKLFVWFAILTVITLGVTKGADAGVTNLGFETGDTTGWTLVVPYGGSAKVVTSHQGNSSTYSPRDGNYFLELKTDGPGSYTTASQTVTLNAGDKLSGWAAFNAQDYLPFNDDASVQIYEPSGVLIATPWYSDVAIVGNYGDGPWDSWSWTAPADGAYTLRYCVANAGDNVVDSCALFDADTTPPEIGLDEPKPSMLWPPNHQFVDVTIIGMASDNCALELDMNVSVEVIDADGGPEHEPDYEIVAATIGEDGKIEIVISLRAERSGEGDGRIYSIAAEVIDDVGHSSIDTVEVLVPHDKGKKK